MYYRYKRSDTKWSRQEDRVLIDFLVRYQYFAPSRRALLHWIAPILGRTYGAIDDREKSLRAPEKQRTSRMFPGVQLYGAFWCGYRKA